MTYRLISKALMDIEAATVCPFLGKHSIVFLVKEIEEIEDPKNYLSKMGQQKPDLLNTIDRSLAS